MNNFHAVLVLAEFALSSKKHRSHKARLSTDEGEEAQEGTIRRYASLTGTPAAAWSILASGGVESRHANALSDEGVSLEFRATAGPDGSILASRSSARPARHF